MGGETRDSTLPFGFRLPAFPILPPPIFWFIILALEIKGTVLFFLLRSSLDIKADETSQNTG